jgi:hypothetical protein
MAVPLKQAVENATQLARDTLGDSASDFQLEEVESMDNNGTSVWQITLSMLRRDPSKLHPRRDYKTFTVRKDTGEVTAMKIREFADK